MDGPKSPTEAMRWIKEALRAGRFHMTRHFVERCAERRVTLADALEAAKLAQSCEPYGADARQGGSCWRLQGRLAAGRRLALGVEAFTDTDGRAAMLITIFATK
jgi:hypothetical protein